MPNWNWWPRLDVRRWCLRVSLSSLSCRGCLVAADRRSRFFAAVCTCSCGQRGCSFRDRALGLSYVQQPAHCRTIHKQYAYSSRSTNRSLVYVRTAAVVVRRKRNTKLAIPKTFLQEVLTVAGSCDRLQPRIQKLRSATSGQSRFVDQQRQKDEEQSYFIANENHRSIVYCSSMNVLVPCKAFRKLALLGCLCRCKTRFFY